VNTEHQRNEVETTEKRTVEKPEEIGPTEVAFKLKVRKLEMPVRPRGVLAE